MLEGHSLAEVHFICIYRIVIGCGSSNAVVGDSSVAVLNLRSIYRIVSCALEVYI